MGYQRPYAYESLVELIFSDGILLEGIDHSKIAEELRNSIDPGDIISLQLDPDSVMQNIETKTWWMTRKGSSLI